MGSILTKGEDLEKRRDIPSQEYSRRDTNV